jgi:hypothetical protein
LGNNISKSKGFPEYIKSFCYINLTNDSDLLNIKFDFINGVEKLKNIIFPDNQREYIINMFNCNSINLLKNGSFVSNYSININGIIKVYKKEDDYYKIVINNYYTFYVDQFTQLKRYLKKVQNLLWY